jgi:hypothetical protein
MAWWERDFLPIHPFFLDSYFADHNWRVSTFFLSLWTLVCAG